MAYIFGNLPESNSPKGQLNSLDLKKTGRQLLMLMAGTCLTVAIDFIAGILTGADLGQYQFVVLLVMNSGILEMLRRLVADHFPVPNKNI